MNGNRWISTTRKVKIQFDAVAKAADFVRMASGAYSAGRTHEIASIPTVKKLKRKSMIMSVGYHVNHSNHPNGVSSPKQA
jgi:hypothetical protein